MNGNMTYGYSREVEYDANGDMIVTIHYDKEFLKTDSSKGRDYNDAINAYNEFLQGKSNVVCKDNDNLLNITVFIDFMGGWDNIGYAILDLNGDGIPELLISSGSNPVFSYQDNNVVYWFDAGNGQHGPIKILENGAIFCEHQSIGIFYRYITFDLDGNISEVNFASPPTPDYPYYFNEDEVSQEEWNVLTEEYFNLTEKTASIEWQLYWT